MRLAREGGLIGCVDINERGLQDTVEDIVASGGRAIAARCDVADLRQVECAVDVIATELGGLEGVANIAGIGEFTGDVTDVDPAIWDRTLAVNLSGVFHVSRTAIPILRGAGGACIVNVSSQFGLVACLASPAYIASKAGVIGLTRAMALDHAGEGIRVNCICPGPVDTPMLAASSDTPAIAARERERTAQRNLVGRPARPEEIAATIGFLMSEEAGAITGSVLSVDGGWTAG